MQSQCLGDEVKEWYVPPQVIRCWAAREIVHGVESGPSTAFFVFIQNLGYCATHLSKRDA
jgi:hypothetical protein